MLGEHIEASLNDNVSVVASKVLNLLYANKNSMIIDLFIKKFLNSNSKYSPEQCMNALTLLFMVGLINLENHRVSVPNV